MRDLGMPLDEIADLMNHRTPEKILNIFAAQNERLDTEIERLSRSKKLIHTLKTIIEGALDIDEGKIDTRLEEAEPILLGPRIDYSGGKSIEEATLDFYRHCEKLDSDMDMNYPVWGVYSEERIRRRDWQGPDRFYFRMPDAPYSKPAGLYLVGYDRGYYGQTDDLYNRLLSHIEENDLEICGPAYETYPLNEISISDSDNYLIKVSISIIHR
jgi:hypothetical protein